MPDLYIVLEEEISGFDPLVNGRTLSDEEPLLNRIAQELGVRPLMEFFSADPEEVTAFIEGEHGVADLSPEDMPDIPAEEWFSATDGLATVQALHQYVKEHPQTVEQASYVLRELEEFDDVLQNAASAGVRWHLAVDF